MTSARESLLSWYRDATQELVNSAPASTDGGQLLDGEGAAMNHLLRRQAASLLRLHDSVTKKEEKKEEDPDGGPVVNTQLLRQRLEDLASISTSKFYAYRYDLVPHHWRQIYTDTLILTTFDDILGSLLAPQNTGWLTRRALDGVVEKLDRAIITAGGAGVLGGAWIEKTVQLLEKLDSDSYVPPPPPRAAKTDEEPPPPKRVKVKIGPPEPEPEPSEEHDAGFLNLFPPDEPHGRPALAEDRSCPRHKGWSLAAFETYMSGGASARPPRPVIFTDLASSWPALTDRPWKSRRYLLGRTFRGRRLVPVEVGRSYVDDGWGQEMVPFGEFLSRYVDADAPAAQTGYLAQHDLFRQIPALRSDISVPDFCWSPVPGHPTDEERNRPALEVPQLNAWFGPARTITPLHTDGYHNLLVQVVGTKYVRLYPPWTEGMRPRGVEDGVDMSNTSALDLGVMEGWDEAGEGGVTAEDMRQAKRDLEGTEYWECILGEGDTLLIPMGWWHYVRSLSVSFSVSFWWN
ncbi:hypothetical protein EsDP_00006023 [Epichloe bromicola]|uniref:JmjC domain-containing protein n=1 Tax=Epichloe bromicola TaxID=79588 RepID=A0ABQ0CWE1_9HYPO